MTSPGSAQRPAWTLDISLCHILNGHVGATAANYERYAIHVRTYQDGDGVRTSLTYNGGVGKASVVWEGAKPVVRSVHNLGIDAESVREWVEEVTASADQKCWTMKSKNVQCRWLRTEPPTVELHSGDPTGHAMGVVHCGDDDTSLKIVIGAQTSHLVLECVLAVVLLYGVLAHHGYGICDVAT